MTEQERQEEIRRVREQIRRDQATNAKRDADALKREQEWYKDQARRQKGGN